MPHDSTADAIEIQRAAWRRMGPTGRLLVAIELSDLTRRLALQGERMRRPHVSEGELRRSLLERLYGVRVGASASR